MAQKKKRRKMRKRTRNRIIFGLICLLVLVILINLVLFIGRSIQSLFNKDDKEKTVEVISKENKDNVVSLIGVGDNLIHDTVYADAQLEDGSYDFSKMYENFENDAQNADIAFINQETILGGVELGLSGYPTFNSPVEIARDLEEAGFNLANLATNHCLDRSDVGIEKELNAFDNTDIVVDGIYTSQEQFNTIPTFTKKGITFSFLAYTYGTNGIEAPNTYNVSYFDDTLIQDEVKRAKEISDVVIVSAHWGDENTFAPSDYQKHFAQVFADCGVDLVIGTHPHTIQPVEWIQGNSGNQMLCVYSLGNFIGGMLTVDNAIGGMISLDFVKEKDLISIQNVKWIPTFIHFEGNQNNILEERYNYKAY
ncbi:MAG: CapA family protein, partial [Floccifex sp.]